MMGDSLIKQRFQFQQSLLTVVLTEADLPIQQIVL